jgi:Fe-S cluster biogenesis protein NfuA
MPPVLNGKRVLPYKIMAAGLKGHKVAGVYAILNKDYKRGYVMIVAVVVVLTDVLWGLAPTGTTYSVILTPCPFSFKFLLFSKLQISYSYIFRSPGWEAVEYVGVSMDLDTSLNNHLLDHGSEKVAHLRAMSFVVPSQGAMNQVADEWRVEVKQAGGGAGFLNDQVLASIASVESVMPYDDDDDDDDDDDEFEMTAAAMSMVRGSSSAVDVEEESSPASSSSEGVVVSPFEKAESTVANGNTPLAFTKENVNQVLDEVRPYLISDGGNVSVDRVEQDTKDIYLKLEGACGSCPSSTVTMKMGIERVLKENFPDMNEVKQVEDEDNANPTELTLEAVEDGVNRVKPAIIAMGGVVRIIGVDSASGEVVLEFRGANKVRGGLELAILDIEFVNTVTFKMIE